MSMTDNLQKFVPLDYDAFLGLDVDKTSIAVTVTNHQGDMRSLRMPYSATNLVRYMHRHVPGRVALAYESGPTGYGLYDDLTAAGYYCMVIAASRIPHIDGQCVKTNRLDSRRIAEALRGGQVKCINIPSPVYRNLRHLVQLRELYVREVAAGKTRIKMLLLFEGIPFPGPEEGVPWSLKNIRELEALPCPATVRFKLNALLSNIAYHKEQLLLTMRHIRTFCKDNEELSHNIRLLTSIPGIGLTSAAVVLARMGDWRYTHNVRQLGSFLGLVPREQSTGLTVRRGSITRAGHHVTRNKLIQCAWIAIRRDPELQSFYEHLRARSGKDAGAKKAIVAVARKLTTRIYAVLRNQRPYVLRTNTAHHAMPPDTAHTPQGTTRRLEEPAVSLSC
jgi:transposase